MVLKMLLKFVLKLLMMVEDEAEVAANETEGADVAVDSAEDVFGVGADAAGVVDAVISSNATDITDTAELVNTGGSRG